MNEKIKLPVFRNSIDLGEYDCGDGASMHVYDNVTASEFAAYCDTFLEPEYVMSSNVNIKRNIHFTFSHKAGILHIYRTADSRIHIIDDPEGKLPCLKKYTGEVKCKTELYQFETDHSLIDCGMCYIVKCCDGSFFIIDGAHFYSVYDNDRLHDFMRSMTPENEKIHISGWFISHGHDDHISTLKNYLKFNMEDTVIDGIYMNLVPADHRDSTGWMESTKAFMQSFADDVKDSKIPVYKLHTGQRFYVRNLKFEVLCTHEDVYPGSLSNFNDTSVVLMMFVDGCKVLFPGDAGAEESKILEERYEEYLRCTVVQMSHHGHFGTSENFYKLANAKVVLCPNTRIKFDEEYHRYKANETALEIADEFYLSAEGTVKLELPYEPGTAYVFPDETTENFDGIKQLWNYEYTEEFMKKHNDEFKKRSGNS